MDDHVHLIQIQNNLFFTSKYMILFDLDDLIFEVGIICSLRMRKPRKDLMERAMRLSVNGGF